MKLETRQKISVALTGKNNPNYGKFGKDSVVWKGGSYSYYHTRARKLYLKNTCQVCGTKREEGKQKLDLHCVSGDWRDLSKDNWICCDRSCHRKIHIKMEINNETN